MGAILSGTRKCLLLPFVIIHALPVPCERDLPTAWNAGFGREEIYRVAHGNARVCEATSSNIFRWEADKLCTVPLGEGCVAGLARTKIIGTAAHRALAVVQKPVTFAAVKTAGEIFLSTAL